MVPRHGLASPPTTLSRAAAVLLLALGLVIGAAAPASAHDALIGSSPAAGASVSTPPTEVVLTFAEPPGNVELSKIIVTGPDGSALADGPPTVDGSALRQPLLPLAQPGEYEIAYRVVSADGHPISGSIPFTLVPPIDEPEPDATTAPQTSSPPASTQPSVMLVPEETPSSATAGAASSPTASPSAGADEIDTAATSGTATDKNDGSVWPWVATLLVVLGLLGAGLLLWSRSRRPDGRTAGPGGS